MTADKSADLYELVRRDLLSGKYRPGDRIPHIAVAEDHHTSTTPVRQVLQRLMGQGLLERIGDAFQVPLPMAAELGDTYRLMQVHLELAIDTYEPADDGEARRRHGVPLVEPLQATSNGELDVAWRTGQLFETIACGAHTYPVVRNARQTNDQLWTIRWAESEASLRDTGEPCGGHLAELNRLWQSRELVALSRALGEYHAHRMRLAPRTFDVLMERTRRRR